MNKVVILKKDNCVRCPPALELGDKLSKMGYHVEYYDTDTPIGLAKSIEHDVMSLPSIIVTNDMTRETIAKWSIDMPMIDQVTTQIEG